MKKNELHINGKQSKLVVFAGPNGSGKTTISRCVKTYGLYINADDIKRSDNSLNDLDAAIEAETLRENSLENHRSFSFETVLSTDRNMNLIARAKKAGYFIECYFVLTADPELNLFRIKARMLNGGHSVPFDKVRERYNKSLKKIPRLIAHCDRIRIIDNTEDPFVIYFKDVDGHEVISENKYWSKNKIINLIGKEIKK